ncbi:hypothetical protein GCM10011444_27900 [Winogradskyella haliclonae]|uniref:Uncharacterized protein n=2 Tax=Winogradskyella haliclonae TaxID=2048558 RepID=A0ABQ2C1P1_9FLAO|nr:hypothetical protein GCM10011444_27900 [Winogradskyella haliclonae]
MLCIDLLGGVDMSQVERMICMLRIAYENYPFYRTTLDLYSDNQTERLTRLLCDKWELPMNQVSRSLHTMVLELETYRLEQLKYKGSQEQLQPSLSDEDREQALQLLSSENLLNEVLDRLHTIGIIGEDTNASILFMTLASHKYSHPFSAVCLAKSIWDKSDVLRKLSDCMPYGSYSYHNRISSNALYYFDSHAIQNKALIIEDLEWTQEMLKPLATLQTQGQLTNTRATKDKHGMLQSTTFKVVGKLCLLACASIDKNYEHLGLPFLMLHLNNSSEQDLAIMDYQQLIATGEIAPTAILQAQHQLGCLISALDNVTVVNPYATLIKLPDTISNPRVSLMLLLNFIEVITYFHQYQRESYVDKTTGETVVITHPDDIALAFNLLKNTLLRKADELHKATRQFYNWLSTYLKDMHDASNEESTPQFTALDIRKAKTIHPRTLNRYLQELKLYHYIEVIGGNKHRGGYRYRLIDFDNQDQVDSQIQASLKTTLNNIKKTDTSPVGQLDKTLLSNSQTHTNSKKGSRTTVKEKP